MVHYVIQLSCSYQLKLETHRRVVPVERFPDATRNLVGNKLEQQPLSLGY